MKILGIRSKSELPKPGSRAGHTNENSLRVRGIVLDLPIGKCLVIDMEDAGKAYAMSALLRGCRTPPMTTHLRGTEIWIEKLPKSSGLVGRRRQIASVQRRSGAKP